MEGFIGTEWTEWRSGAGKSAASVSQPRGDNSRCELRRAGYRAVMGYRLWPWETMPRCGMPRIVGYPNVGIPCRKGSSLWPYRAVGDTLSLRRPSEVLASVDRCAGLTVRWRSGVPAHRVHRTHLGAALRGLAPLPPGAQPLPCCNTPCCNAAHPVATFCAILQHSARSCIR